MKPIYLPAVILGLLTVSCLSKSGREVLVKYDSIGDLKIGGEVYCKNVPIGRISDLKLLNDYKVLVELELEEQFRSRIDSVALVTSGPLIPQYIEIIPSLHQNNHKNGDTITGVFIDKRSQNLDNEAVKVIRDSIMAPFIRK